MRTPVALYALALAVRAVLIALYPDPAYPDSYYYVEVARSIAAGNGLNVDFIWIFAEVGARIPDSPVLPIPSNAHWLPLASFLQAPFISLFGPSAVASALSGALIGSLAAPLTWAIARDAGSAANAARAAGILVAIPGSVTVFMAQPETFPLTLVIVPFTLWMAARGLRGDGRAFALAGLGAGILALTRNDGVLLAGTLGLIWLADRVHFLRARRSARSWSRVDERHPISLTAGVLAGVLFLAAIGPWWLRQLSLFGSVSPTSSSGAAIWIRDIREWNSIVAHPSLQTFLSQGLGPIIASRIDGLTAALTIFTVLVCSVVLLPFLLAGIARRRSSNDFQPWFAYTFVVFAGAAVLYPLHVPGGTFIHMAIGLLPHAMILSVEGVVAFVGFMAGRRSNWNRDQAGGVFLWGLVALVVAIAVVFGRPVQVRWDATRAPRVALAAYMDGAGIPRDDRVLSIDAGGIKYFTGHPGVVTPDDPLDTIEAVARAYSIRWLVIEKSDAALSLAPVLNGTRTSWIGEPVFELGPASDSVPTIALYPVCIEPADKRCGT